MLQYTTRPLSDRAWLNPARRRASRFDSDWRSTQALLNREIHLLNGRNIVIEVDVREGDLRMDGQLKARAKAASPAVRMAFESRQHGPMLFQCDRYNGGPYFNRMEPWQHNVRAIALTLEALRAVERHEAIDSGQQYTGFKAIESGGGLGERAADAILRKYAGPKASDDLQENWKWARRHTHPDKHEGDHTMWNELEEAGKVLGLL